MTTDTLGDRMKAHEAADATLLPPRSWCVLRVDGRAFHSWTRGLDRPFDTDLAEACRSILGVTAEGFLNAYDNGHAWDRWGHEDVARLVMLIPFARAT